MVRAIRSRAHIVGLHYLDAFAPGGGVEGGTYLSQAVIAWAVLNGEGIFGAFTGEFGFANVAHFGPGVAQVGPQPGGAVFIAVNLHHRNVGPQSLAIAHHLARLGLARPFEGFRALLGLPLGLPDGQVGLVYFSHFAQLSCLLLAQGQRIRGAVKGFNTGAAFFFSHGLNRGRSDLKAAPVQGCLQSRG